MNQQWSDTANHILETALRLIVEKPNVSYNDIGNACRPIKLKQSVHRVLKDNNWKFYKAR